MRRSHLLGGCLVLVGPQSFAPGGRAHTALLGLGLRCHLIGLLGWGIIIIFVIPLAIDHDFLGCQGSEEAGGHDQEDRVDMETVVANLEGGEPWTIYKARINKSPHT